MLHEVAPLEMVIRLAVSIALGTILGFDREAKNKPAGLRTHAMVSLGSAAFILATLHLARESHAAGVQNSDPTRLIEGLVGGMGFLGAGTIIQSGGHVKGITTAATIWVAGSVGLACGIGQYTLAALVVVGSLMILEGLNLVERWMKPSKKD